MANDMTGGSGSSSSKRLAKCNTVPSPPSVTQKSTSWMSGSKASSCVHTHTHTHTNAHIHARSLCLYACPHGLVGAADESWLGLMLRACVCVCVCVCVWRVTACADCGLTCGHSVILTARSTYGFIPRSDNHAAISFSLSVAGGLFGFLTKSTYTMHVHLAKRNIQEGVECACQCPAQSGGSVGC